MATTSEVEFFCSLPGWQRYGNRIEKTFDFDDFSVAARFVARMADAAAVAGRQPAIDLRRDCVTVRFAPLDGSALTVRDVAVARPSSGSSATTATRSVEPAPGVPAEP
jgi:pterin-4a-carbinolamine dehydratase